LATGSLLWGSYFPANRGWLAWVALVPILTLVRRELSGRAVFLNAWAGALLFFVPALQWLRVADPMMYYTWAALSLYCSLFVPAGVLLIRRLDRTTRLPLILTVPLVWTALEYLRAHALGGFPWYFLGHSQHDFLALTQVADLGGAYAVSFLVAGVNAIVFEWLYSLQTFQTMFRQRAPQSGWGMMTQTALVVLVMGGAIGYGFWRLSQQEFRPGPRLALIQGCMDQGLRNQATDEEGNTAAKSVLNHYQDLNDQAAVQRPRPDLLVWPETSSPIDWVEVEPGEPNDNSRVLARNVGHRWGTFSVLGLNAEIGTPEQGRRRYNSALLVSPDGQFGPRYDKIHRVPFGEFVPLKDVFPWMSHFAPYDYDYSIYPGKELTRFPLGKYRFGVLICYEDTDPCLARQYVTSGSNQPPADFLLNISNDGWFKGSSEHEEHLAICRFRAIESRRAVARAVNMGVSAVIDGSGRVLEPSRIQPKPALNNAPVWEVAWQTGRLREFPSWDWSRLKKVPAVILAAVPIDHRFSLYAVIGDWLPLVCWLLVGIGLTWSLWKRASARLAGSTSPER
jgi:apolipoprotein N-acyltransferase